MQIGNQSLTPTPERLLSALCSRSRELHEENPVSRESARPGAAPAQAVAQLHALRSGNFSESILRFIHSTAFQNCLAHSRV